MEVKEIIQTSIACPSQWEGILKDGRMFYIRYRWGVLTIQLSKQPINDLDKVISEDWNLIYSEQLGDELDGVLEQTDLIQEMEMCGFIFT